MTMINPDILPDLEGYTDPDGGKMCEGSRWVRQYDSTSGTRSCEEPAVWRVMINCQSGHEMTKLYGQYHYEHLDKRGLMCLTCLARGQENICWMVVAERVG